MPSNKDRLYIALYARGGAPTMPGLKDTYHWALMVGPKEEIENGRGMRYHTKERIIGPNQMQWVYEERDIPLQATNMLLVRILIGKDDPAWNCVIWVKRALEALGVNAKALGTSQIDWNTVRDTAMRYCQDKKDEHRFDGKGSFDLSKAPTYDLLEGRETIP